MRHTLVHLYEPFSIYSYGLMIALGILIFIWFLQRDPKRAALVSNNQLIDILLLGIVAGFIGGRGLYLITSWSQWNELFRLDGFSIIGSILGILVIMPWYLKKQNIPILEMLDLLALYGPTAQVMGRIGCFLAGCCYGNITDAQWAVVYTDHESLAPLGLCLHPAQLYSAILLLIIFILLYFVFRPLCNKPGQLCTIYLFLVNAERFSTDFFRGDREFFSGEYVQQISIHQWFALILMIVATIGFILVSHRGRTAHHESV